MLIINKIKNKLHTMKSDFNNDKQFSLYYALLRIFTEITHRLHLNKFSLLLKTKREKWITNYLSNILTDVISEVNIHTENSNGYFDSKSPIWISWWTGEDTAPELVRQCIKSIKKNANNRKIVFITQENYLNYIDIPNFIIDKAQSGNMKLAHLCDYIRIALLEKYGGIWLDSTIFCSDQIPDEYFQFPFFTCRSETDEKCSYVSKMRWVTFVFGGYKHNIVFNYLKKAFEHYWQSNNTAIDYLFFDHLIEIGYDCIPDIKKMIDSVPINNIHRDDLQSSMNEKIHANKFYSIIKPDTVLYKLSWRETYAETTDDGQPTVYKYFLNL